MNDAGIDFKKPVVAIIGLGNVGKIHEAAYRRLGCLVVVIDPAAGDGALRDIGEMAENLQPDLWVVATPTGNHVSTIKRIFERDANANILCEKPLCEPAQVEAALEILRARKGQVKINSLYRHSEAVAALARELGDSPIDSITIEFAKNRYEDAHNGRFIDRTLGALGYEWFHIATILGMLLPEADFCGYTDRDDRFSLVKCDRYVFSAFRERMTTHSGIALDLATSVDGMIHHSLPVEIGQDFAADYLAALSTRNIPFGSGVRHRFVKIDAADSEFYLVFHPFAASVADVKNTHLLVRRTAGQMSKRTILDNHFEAAARHSLQATPSEAAHRGLCLDLDIQLKIGRLASMASSQLDRARHTAGAAWPATQGRHDSLSFA